jgi:hypothetical protein
MSIAVIVGCALLVGLPAQTKAKAAVLPIAGFDGRASLRGALVDLDRFDVVTNEYLDGVVADLASTGLVCRADDDACLARLAVNAGVDVLIAGSTNADELTLRLIDTRPGAPRSTTSATAKATDATRLVARLFEPAPLAIASAPLPKPAPPTPTPKAPPSSQVARSPEEAPPARLAPSTAGPSLPLLAGGVATGVVTIALAVTVGVLEVQAQHNIDVWKQGLKPPVDAATQKRNDVIEYSSAGGVVVGAVGTGALVVLGVE